MPQSKGNGGKNRRRGKNDNDEKRELFTKDDEQEYAQVLRMLGQGRVEAMCFDGKKRLCNIRGKLRKRVWINVGDIVMISLREFQDEKADVILKYTADEARQLKAMGEIPDNGKQSPIYSQIAKIVDPDEEDDKNDDEVEIVFEEI